MPEFYSLNDVKENFGDMFKGISIDLFEKDSKILEAEDELQLYKKRIIKDDQDNNEKIKKNFSRRALSLLILFIIFSFAATVLQKFSFSFFRSSKFLKRFVFSAYNFL